MLCAGIAANPAATLILFGLAKYHLLFAAIAAWAAAGAGGAAGTRAALWLSAANFAADDVWAAAHLRWIGAGPVVLLPQAALVAWLVRTAARA